MSQIQFVVNNTINRSSLLDIIDGKMRISTSVYFRVAKVRACPNIVRSQVQEDV